MRFSTLCAIAAFDAFAPKAFKHAQGMSGFAVEDRVGQPEDIEACAVGHGRLDRFHRNLATFGHQLELFDFLGGGQQVAFDPGGNQLNRVLAGRQAGLGQALANPAGQLADVHRPDRRVGDAGADAVDQGVGDGVDGQHDRRLGDAPIVA